MLTHTCSLARSLSLYEEVTALCIVYIQKSLPRFVSQIRLCKKLLKYQLFNRKRVFSSPKFIVNRVTGMSYLVIIRNQVLNHINTTSYDKLVLSLSSFNYISFMGQGYRKIVESRSMFAKHGVKLSSDNKN